MNTVPEGFNPLARRSPFTDLIGPIYSHTTKTSAGDESLVLAIRSEEKHCNARGFVHGGVLCTLADIAMGYNAVIAAQAKTGMVTSQLSMDFAGSAKLGDWISVEVDVQKVGVTLAFTNCYFTVAKSRIARASAIFCRPRSTTA